MKKNLLSALLLITIGTQAQTIVNAGFENYKTNTTEEPVGWIPKSEFTRRSGQLQASR
jgi:hypothetical protein